jgi:CRP-like cAMP-binding protein
MTPVIGTTKKRDFDPTKFLTALGGGRKIVPVTKKQTIYAQGAACDAVFYIQKGKVGLTVVAKNGKEAMIGILNKGDFFGEGGLAGQPLRMGTATTMTDCELMRIEKKAMMESASPRTYIVRHIHGVFVGAEHPIRSGFRRPAFQFQRKETSTDSAVACSIRQGRQARDCIAQDQSRDSRGDGGHNPVTDQLLHEQIPKDGFH